MLPALIFLGIAVLVGAAIYLKYYLKKKRILELRLFAKQAGLEFSQVDMFALIGYPFALFQKGDGRGCENVMWGTWQGLPLREFDYWYYEESTDSNGNTSRSYYRFSCVTLDVAASCPHLTIAHENLFTRMADHLGFRDIEFETEEFNKAFNVKSPDRKFANDMIDSRMMQWLLQSGSDWGYEVIGSQMLIYSKRRAPMELLPLLGTAKEFLGHVPKVVYELYGSAGQQ